jgi:hypothetical protein
MSIHLHTHTGLDPCLHFITQRVEVAKKAKYSEGRRAHRAKGYSVSRGAQRVTVSENEEAQGVEDLEEPRRDVVTTERGNVDDVL